MIATVLSANQIVVEHGEIKGVMDAMTMGYRVEPSSLLEGLKAGDQVRFTIDVPNKTIVKIETMEMILLRDERWHGQSMQDGCSALLFAGGCASMALDAGFDDVSAAVGERSGSQIFWNNGTELDKDAAEKLDSLLKRQLTADDAVQIALLNNRELQALYSDLGVAQADLVQAGLLTNPIFDAAVKFPTSGQGPPRLELTAAMNFLNIFYIPLRKRVAAARFEETKTRVTGAVLDFAGRVRGAFYAYEADEQILELRRTIVQALDASFEIARRLSQAGNITDLDLARERAQLEAGKLALRSAEISVRQSREELNILMGLWGTNPVANCRTLTRNSRAADGDQGYRTVVAERSLDLVQARQRIVGAGEELGLTRWTTLLPDFSVGPKGERNDGAWEVGPKLEFPIPLFDQGQARGGRSSRGAAALSAGVLRSGGANSRASSRATRPTRRSRRSRHVLSRHFIAAARAHRQ